MGGVKPCRVRSIFCKPLVQGAGLPIISFCDQCMQALAEMIGHLLAYMCDVYGYISSPRAYMQVLAEGPQGRHL